MPQAFVAVQVTVFVPRGNALPLAGTQPMSAPLVTVGFAKVTTVVMSHPLVVRAAGQVRVTGAICCTTKLKEQVLEPQALVALQVMVFVPTENTLPLAGTQAMSAPPLTVGFANVAGALVPQMRLVERAEIGRAHV